MTNCFKFISLGFIGLILSACSETGAQAQSAPTHIDQKSQVQIQKNWTVDQSKSALAFTGSMSGDQFEGKFESFDASIFFDPEDLKSTNIHVSIDMSSVDANDAERNDALPGKEWFFVKSFPRAVFTSNQVIKKGDAYEASGTLTLKDISKAVTLPFELEFDGDTVHMMGSTTLNRTDFDVGTGTWKSEDWVAHTVAVNVVIHAKKSE